MSFTSRSRNVAKVFAIPYQRAHQLVLEVHDESHALAREKGWPLADADIHLLRIRLRGSSGTDAVEREAAVEPLFTVENLQTVRAVAEQTLAVVHGALTSFVDAHREELESFMLGMQNIGRIASTWVRANEPALRQLQLIANDSAEAKRNLRS